MFEKGIKLPAREEVTRRQAQAIAAMKMEPGYVNSEPYTLYQDGQPLSEGSGSCKRKETPPIPRVSFKNPGDKTSLAGSNACVKTVRCSFYSDTPDCVGESERLMSVHWPFHLNSADMEFSACFLC